MINVIFNDESSFFFVFFLLLFNINAIIKFKLKIAHSYTRDGTVWGGIGASTVAATSDSLFNALRSDAVQITHAVDELVRMIDSYHKYRYILNNYQAIFLIHQSISSPQPFIHSSLHVHPIVATPSLTSSSLHQ